MALRDWLDIAQFACVVFVVIFGNDLLGKRGRQAEERKREIDGRFTSLETTVKHVEDCIHRVEVKFSESHAVVMEGLGALKAQVPSRSEMDARIAELDHRLSGDIREARQGRNG